MSETQAERQTAMDELTAMTDELHKTLRARKIRSGIDPDAPEPTVEERLANVERLRADNEAKLAVIRRRATLRVVQ